MNFDSLWKKKQEDGIKENQNNTVWYLTSQTLSNNEYQPNFTLWIKLWISNISCQKKVIFMQPQNRFGIKLAQAKCKESNNHRERGKDFRIQL